MDRAATSGGHSGAPSPRRERRHANETVAASDELLGHVGKADAGNVGNVSCPINNPTCSSGVFAAARHHQRK
jgi:hypothetical protein